MRHVAIVGAGLAGFSVARRLRELDYTGAITLFGDEGALPYDRPPLSKGSLKASVDASGATLRPSEFFEENQIALRPSEPVLGIDTTARTLQLRGEAFAFDALVLATGATPRALPNAIIRGLHGVHGLRTLADAQRISQAFGTAQHALIVGGGYIGLEVAAAAAERGLRVTLIEAGPRILGRVAGPPTADAIRAAHKRKGVDIREGVGLSALVGTDQVKGAILSDGAHMAADCVIVGIGIDPNVTLAKSAGLATENGILVDPTCQTSQPGIWAAGDCAAFPMADQITRLESVGNAIEMGEVVAANIMGQSRPYAPTPWFWSDQFDLKLQMVGLSPGYDRIVTRPGVNPDAISHWYYAGERLLSADVINEPKTYMIAKRLIETGKSPPPAQIADQSVNLKVLLKS